MLHASQQDPSLVSQTDVLKMQQRVKMIHSKLQMKLQSINSELMELQQLQQSTNQSTIKMEHIVKKRLEKLNTSVTMKSTNSMPQIVPQPHTQMPQPALQQLPPHMPQYQSYPPTNVPIQLPNQLPGQTYGHIPTQSTQPPHLNNYPQNIPHQQYTYASQPSAPPSTHQMPNVPQIIDQMPSAPLESPTKEAKEPQQSQVSLIDL
eukprot:NODE_161_length_14984_cov_0.487000.p5 type:complete len:205 gc:universal NODE_161_length_14984_cov_0.487000:13761-14375(+)